MRAFSLALALSLLLAGPRASSSQESTFTTGVDVVVVDAVVFDKQGDPVEGLTADDFVLEDEGRRQSITSFEAISLKESGALPTFQTTRVSTNVRGEPKRAQRTFVIVFDDVHMAPERIGQAREAVGQFVRTGLAAGDQVTLVPTSGGAWWSTTMPEGKEDLIAALERLAGLRPRNTRVDRIADWEALRLQSRDPSVLSEVARRFYEHRIILEPPGGNERADLQVNPGLPLITAMANEVYQAGRERRLATLRLLERVAASLGGLRGRKSIILVSEGFVYEPTLPEFRDLVRATRQTNAAVYFVDARGLSDPAGIGYDAELAERTDPRDIGSGINLDVLDAQGAISIALETGGFTVRNRNDLAGGLDKIGREARSYYLLGFQPDNVKRDGKFRRVSLKVVGRGDVTVRARKGYYAPEDGKRPSAPTKDTLAPPIRQALDAPYMGSDIPLRLSALVLDEAPEKKANVLLIAEADPRALKLEERGGRLEDVLESFVIVSSRDTGENQHQEKQIELSLPVDLRAQLEASWLRVFRDFRLSPGVYQARLLLKDRNSGRIGTVRHVFEIPAFETFRTSTPLLTDVLEAPPPGSPQPPRPIPIARRTFAPGRTVYYAFEVFGARRDPSGAPQVAAGYQLQAPNGKVVAKQDVAPLQLAPGGRLQQVFAMPLSGVVAGEYEIVLRVSDSVAGQVLEVRDPLIVAEP